MFKYGLLKNIYLHTYVLEMEKEKNSCQKHTSLCLGMFDNVPDTCIML